MVHNLRLSEKPFNSIKNKTKTIEMRLYDEKRKKIKVGDTILFALRDDSSCVLETKVKSLKMFENFEQLYKHFDKTSLGYKQDEKASPDDMNFYYSKEEQALYGVVAIEIEVI